MVWYYLIGREQDIYHERAWLNPGQAVDVVAVKCIIETTSREESTRLLAGISEKYNIIEQVAK